MNEAVGHGRVEDDLPPVGGIGDPVAISKPCGVCIQEFRTRIQKADIVVPKATRKVASVCSQAGHAAEAEQHDAEEHRLEEEGRQHLVGEQAARRCCRRFP
jgi:hypothetical protein